MQVQELFSKATEFYGDNGYFKLEDEEYKFLLKEIKDLNEKTILSKLEEMRIKGVFAILLYAEKESCIETLNLNNVMKKLFEKVYSEFC